MFVAKIVIMCQCANVLSGYSWLFACEDGFSRIFVGAGHALRLQFVFFFKIQPPSGLWIMGDCLLYGGLTPSGSVILVLSAGIYTNGVFDHDFYNQQ